MTGGSLHRPFLVWFFHFLSIVALCAFSPSPSIRQGQSVTTKWKLQVLYETRHGQDDDARRQVEEDGVDFDSISDAEALLACRSYLQKRKRWGNWTKADTRKVLRQRYLGSMKNEERSRSGGYFWEDPSQLRYLNKKLDVDFEGIGTSLSIEGPNTVDLAMDEDEDEDQMDEDEIWESVKLQGSMGRRDLLPLIDNDKALGESAEEFSPFYDAGPSQEHVRRSEAAKRRWSDEEWREFWYEKRWGGRRTPLSAELKKQKRIELRLQKLDHNILENPALANMTEEEVSEALSEYIRSSKRTLKKKPTNAKGKSETQLTQPSALDLFTSQNVDAQQELQRKRSERARKAYQVRLENQERHQKPRRRRNIPPSATIAPEADATPLMALRHVETCLNNGCLPEASDLKIMLQPSRLSRRKTVLLRVLTEGLGIRGKCIPRTLNVPIEQLDPSTFKFATQVSVAELGRFIVHNLENRNETNQ